MNKTERQLAITLELQRSKTLRAEDLASQLNAKSRLLCRSQFVTSQGLFGKQCDCFI